MSQETHSNFLGTELRVYTIIWNSTRWNRQLDKQTFPLIKNVIRIEMRQNVRQKDRINSTSGKNEKLFGLVNGKCLRIVGVLWGTM